MLCSSSILSITRPNQRRRQQSVTTIRPPPRQQVPTHMSQSAVQTADRRHCFPPSEQLCVRPVMTQIHRVRQQGIRVDLVGRNRVTGSQHTRRSAAQPTRRAQRARSINPPAEHSQPGRGVGGVGGVWHVWQCAEQNKPQDEHKSQKGLNHIGQLKEWEIGYKI